MLAGRRSAGTPWHPHHIAERYGLFVIIALGEGVFGTVATVSSVVATTGWNTEAVLLVVAGIGLVFGLWWTYFTIPSGEVLAARRDRRFGWAYGHIPVFASVAAVGAGLHVAAYVIEGKAQIGTLGAVVSVAVPVLLFTATLLAVYTLLLRELDILHLGLFAATAAVLSLAVGLAATGVPLGVCLIVVMLAPVPGVVGWETVGRRHQAETLERVLGRPRLGGPHR